MKMKVMGIDPGLALMGYGVIESDGNRFRTIDYGVIDTPADMSEPDRLLLLWKELNVLLEKYKPDAVSVEELFFNKNVKTAISIGQARGVILLAVKNCNIFVAAHWHPICVEKTSCTSFLPYKVIFPQLRITHKELRCEHTLAEKNYCSIVFDYSLILIP